MVIYLLILVCDMSSILIDLQLLPNLQIFSNICRLHTYVDLWNIYNLCPHVYNCHVNKKTLFGIADHSGLKCIIKSVCGLNSQGYENVLLWIRVLNVKVYFYTQNTNQKHESYL